MKRTDQNIPVMRQTQAVKQSLVQTIPKRLEVELSDARRILRASLQPRNWPPNMQRLLIK